MSLADDAKRDGYALLKAVFPSDLMAAYEHELGKMPMGVVGAIRDWYAIVDFARELLGPDLIDTGESNFNHNPQSIYTDWHRDQPGPDGTVMPAWRFAVYFRDYTTHSGGLAVAPGSHLRRALAGGVDVFNAEVEVIQSAPGDVVVWNLRTLHAAGANNKGLPIASPRNAVFFDYAAPHPSVDQYIAWRKTVRESQRARGKVSWTGA